MDPADIARSATASHRRSRRLGPRSGRVGLVGIIVLLVVVGLGSPAAAADPPIELEIHGAITPTERYNHTYTARFVRRPLETSTGGYSPIVAGDPDRFLPTEWETPVELIWTFGDGPAISTGERPVVIHRFDEEGSQTIRLEMRNRHGETVATATKDVTVSNAGPGIRYLKAVRVGDSDATVELSAHAIATPGEVLTYHWDFGDGELAEGTDLWRVRHRYALEGTYPVTLTVHDGVEERSKTLDVAIYGTGDLPAGPGSNPDDDEPVEAVVSGLEAKLSGGIETTLQGEIRSLAGLHLSSISGGLCRFMFTAWDPAQLAHVWVILDLDGLPGEEGGTYRFRNPRVSVNLESRPEAYLQAQSNQNPMSRLSQSLGPLIGSLPESGRGQIARGTGLAPSADAGYDDRAPAAASPFGLDDHEGFKATSGQLVLRFVPNDRATGTFSLRLANTASKPPPGLETLDLEGSFALDLQKEQQRGIMLYDRCGEGRLGVEKLNPAPDEQHVRIHDPFIDVVFDRPVDPSTLNAETFQIGYPEPGGENLVLAAGRLVKGPTHVVFVPASPLLDGVRYTARLKTGPDGVLSLSGGEIPQEGGSEWLSWRFETRIDFALETGGNLSCHLFQTVRDPRLIAGKPAVARVYADWKEHAQVDPSAHVRSFDARVLLWNDRRTAAGPWVPHTFVRPNLWSNLGIDTARAAHTANLLGWTPTEDSSMPLRLAVQVKKEPDKDWDNTVYRTVCPAEVWDRTPELRFDVYMAAVGSWEGNRYADFLPVALEVAADAETYAWQQFPFADVEQRFAGVIFPQWEEDIPWCQVPAEECREICDGACVASIYLSQAASLSDADVVAFFAPLGELGGGGGTFYEVDQESFGFGLVFMGLDREPSRRQRFVHGLVHEIGHALWIQHLPQVTAASRARLRGARNESWAGGAPLRWEGIESFRMARDGSVGWNKSSTEGNEEASSLAPLMFPATLKTTEAMIARHQYLRIQDAMEAGGGRWADLPPLPGPRLASLGPVDAAGDGAGGGRMPGEPVGLVGVLAPDDRVAVLGPLVRQGPGGWKAPTAQLALVLLDASGRELSRGPGFVAAARGDSPGRPFRGSVAWHEEAVRLEVRREGRLLASRDRSPTVPTGSLRVLGDPQGERPLVARWTASDGDGGPLGVSLVYSPDGGSDWTVVGAGLAAEGELSIDPQHLVAGERPAFRLLVHDGFRTAEVPAER